MTTDTDALLGTVVGGRWRMTRKLGEGGMGAVYGAEATDGQEERAIKVLHKEFVKEEQVVTRFYAEAEASRRLDHPNIARIYESGKLDTGEPFLLMELLRGKPLADANPEGSRMPADQAVPIVKSVLVALTEAHRQDIVHRDLKPDNIFLCQTEGSPMVPKLLDFGIARVIDAAGGGMRKTKTGMLLGTPGYMSPEQLRNSKSVDPRSDLWSLATVFYELLSGRDPYGATNDFARLTAVFTQESIPIDRDDPTLAPWREFFLRSFARDINQRFQSAHEMDVAIDAVVRGEPLPPLQPPIQPPASNVAAVVSAPAGSGPKSEVNPLAATAPSVTAPPIAFQQPPPTQAPPTQPPATPPVTVASPANTAPAAQGSGKLVWGLIAIVLLLGVVIVGLALKTTQDDKKPHNGNNPPGTTGATTKPTPPSAPTKKH